MKTVLLSVCLFFVVVGAGCGETRVTILTTPPPGRVVLLDYENEAVEMSRGVAIALECFEWGEASSGPCRELEVTVDDDERASVLPAHLDSLTGGYSSNIDLEGGSIAGPAERAGAVVAALSAGETRLRVQSATSASEFALVVLDVPRLDDE